MLDKFGQAVRNIRITRSLLLYNMAEDLGISSSQLSGIERGTKPIPKWFIPKLETTYNIGHEYTKTLYILADMCYRELEKG